MVYNLIIFGKYALGVHPYCTLYHGKFKTFGEKKIVRVKWYTHTFIHILHIYTYIRNLPVYTTCTTYYCPLFW